jgi:hypothetical protein
MDIEVPCWRRYSLAIKRGARPDAPEAMIPMKLPVQRERKIPNNNLNGTRQVVREKPELYEDKKEGPLLEPLREILGAQTKFEQCVDIAAEVDMSLCSLSTDPKAAESLVRIVRVLCLLLSNIAKTEGQVTLVARPAAF